MGVLDGKVAVVTGAGHGVGRGYALAMAAAGAKVVVNDLGGSPTGGGADATAAEEVARLIVERGGQAVANGADVADFGASREMVAQAVEVFGALDVLVLNAGITRNRMIFNMDEADWDDVARVHLNGHFAPARHAAVHWRALSKETGRSVDASIICTTSIAGLRGNVGQSSYVTAKAGIAMFAVALAQDLERYGVRANAIAPSGLTRLVALLPGRDEEVREPDEYEGYVDTDPANMAPLAVWLASDLSRHVNGQVFFAQHGSVTHYRPWTPGATVTVPGGDRRWEAEELGRALDAMAFGSRHSGLDGVGYHTGGAR
ncbi:MAG: short-chain dehydrogenase/reductase [Actinomycetia bacterium]|nr:short-chain dehydrogenase/reductase [Actinomycetes bacterium]